MSTSLHEAAFHKIATVLRKETNFYLNVQYRHTSEILQEIFTEYNKFPSSLLPVRLLFLFVLCMALREQKGITDRIELESRLPMNCGSVSGFSSTIQTGDKAHTVFYVIAARTLWEGF